MLRKTLFIGLVILYGFLFFLQEKLVQQVPPALALPLPSAVQKTVLGYLRQLGGEMHFIKTAVFIGGHFTNKPDDTYTNGLSRNFKVMVDLHPEFIDSFYLCQSTFAFIGPEPAREANIILQKGLDADPTNWIFPFFQSFNYNHFLGEPRKAADALLIASKIDGAPAWLEHLASIRAAQGGDILSGLIWLKAMHKAELNEGTKARYGREIKDFEMALNVQKAIGAYQLKYGYHPAALEDLVPDFIPSLPVFHERFVLRWEPPILRLKRPDRKILSK